MATMGLRAMATRPTLMDGTVEATRRTSLITIPGRNIICTRDIMTLSGMVRRQAPTMRVVVIRAALAAGVTQEALAAVMAAAGIDDLTRCQVTRCLQVATINGKRPLRLP